MKVVYELRQKYPVKALVKLACIPRSSYYYYVRQMDKANPDADLKEEIQSIYDEQEDRYGYRRIRDELAIRGKNESQEGPASHERVGNEVSCSYEKV